MWVSIWGVDVGVNELEVELELELEASVLLWERQRGLECHECGTTKRCRASTYKQTAAALAA